MSSSSSSISKGQLISSISSTTDLIDAKLEQQQLCGFKQCPGCGHRLQGTQPDWVGLPAGVKFDPTDQELIEHLEAKVEGKSSESHPLIDEFIPTIEGEDGICYTHPEKLPGVTRDGLSRHFFHRPSRAYTTGTRKRRKIQMSESDDHRGGGGETRWHKTGKTRPVMGKGKQIKGCKKILVLYTNFGKNRKPEKTNWVMHQYHLGLQEEEKEGELVVSKIFYQTQPRQLCNWSSATTTTATTTRAAMEGGGEASGRSGSTSSSSKEVVITSTTSHHDQRDNNNNNIGCGPSLSSYAHALDLHHLSQGSHLSNFIPFRKSFDEATIGDVSTAMDVAAMSAQHQLHHHHGMSSSTHEHHHLHHAMATNAFHHINKPSESISQILCPTPLLDHQGSIILDDDSFHLSRIMLQNESFQDQQQQQQQETEHQQHDKMGGRSASGLEEIIMSCTPSSAAIKEESSITNTPEETDQWLKYSSFWHDPDNPDHHG